MNYRRSQSAQLPRTAGQRHVPFQPLGRRRYVSRRVSCSDGSADGDGVRHGPISDELGLAGRLSGQLHVSADGRHVLLRPTPSYGRLSCRLSDIETEHQYHFVSWHHHIEFHHALGFLSLSPFGLLSFFPSFFFFSVQ